MFRKALNEHYACQVDGHNVCLILDDGSHRQLSTLDIKIWADACSNGKATVKKSPSTFPCTEPKSVIPEAASLAIPSRRSSTETLVEGAAPFPTQLDPRKSPTPRPTPHYYSKLTKLSIGSTTTSAVEITLLNRKFGMCLQQLHRWNARFKQDSTGAAESAWNCESEADIIRRHSRRWELSDDQALRTMLGDIIDMSRQKRFIRPNLPSTINDNAYRIVCELNTLMTSNFFGMAFQVLESTCALLIIIKLMEACNKFPTLSTVSCELFGALLGASVGEHGWECIVAAMDILRINGLESNHDIIISLSLFGSEGTEEEISTLLSPNAVKNNDTQKPHLPLLTIPSIRELATFVGSRRPLKYLDLSIRWLATLLDGDRPIRSWKIEDCNSTSLALDAILLLSRFVAVSVNHPSLETDHVIHTTSTMAHSPFTQGISDLTPVTRSLWVPNPTTSVCDNPAIEVPDGSEDSEDGEKDSNPPVKPPGQPEPTKDPIMLLFLGTFLEYPKSAHETLIKGKEPSCMNVKEPKPFSGKEPKKLKIEFPASMLFLFP
ncbi:hypothetical protein BU17DRAFT_85337 [Hysterangium stoloniferum]|nr:hypothetical protein BU17DRAFT_85337 [Hysterangium stoloniferum]